MNLNIHVAIASACLVVISAYNSNLQPIAYSEYFVFFSTLFAYHFIRVFESCECTYKVILGYLKKQSFMVLGSIFIAFIGTFYYAYSVGVRRLWIVLPAALITLGYVIPLFKYKGKRVSIRNYPRIKLLSIALVWSILTVLFPLQYQLSEPQVWIEFVQRFFLIMALAIPFDIRDMHIDAPHLQTLPQQIGISKAKQVGILLLVLFFLLIFLKYPLNLVSVFAELLVFILSLLFLVKAKQKQSKYYSSFWVESVPIIWWFIILVFVALKSEVASFG